MYLMLDGLLEYSRGLVIISSNIAITWQSRSDAYLQPAKWPWKYPGKWLQKRNASGMGGKDCTSVVSSGKNNIITSLGNPTVRMAAGNIGI
jgi:hypothetical protein